MAVDKLVDSTQLNTDLTSVANAIRTKGGTSAQLAFPSGFVTAINDIQTGTGTTHILVEQAGKVTEDVTEYAYAEVNAVKDATASGAVASFSDGAEDVPMDSCLVDIEPVQNLNGQSNPYPPGGGKNKCGTFEVGTWQESSSVGSDYANMKTTNNARLRSIDLVPVTYPMTISIASSYQYALIVFDSNKKYLGSSSFLSFRSTAYTQSSAWYGGGTYVAFVIKRNDSGNMTDADISNNHLQIETGSSATSYAPYSNICPISGWSEVNVSVTGVNLFDKDTVQLGYVDNATGEIKGQTGSMNYKCTDFIRVASGNTYYIKTTQTAAIWGAWYDINKAFISGITGYANTTKTAPANAYYVRLTVSSNQTGDVNSFAVNYPSTDTEYHAYTGTSYPVSLGQTVYGGTLDVVTGELTIDRGIASLADQTIVYTSANQFFSMSISGKKSGLQNMIMSHYAYGGWWSSWADKNNVYCGNANNNGVVIKDTRYSDVTTFKSAMSNLQIVYELATPTTVQLTPTEVTTLLGSNNVWADSGDISVGYKADIFLYVDSLETIIDTLTGGA